VIGPAPMCVDCKRYDRETGTCSAYPDAILQEIFMNQWDHRLRGPARSLTPSCRQTSPTGVPAST